MKIQEKKKAYLLLADGQWFEGTSIGSEGTSGGEICFNTGMTGYQEVYTDPSYYGQIVVNTNSHIGNYGAVDREQESDGPKIKGLVINDFSEMHSRFEADASLDEYLKKHNIVGIADLDTRKVVKSLRSEGAMNAIISSDISEIEKLKEELDKVPSMNHLELGD